MLTIVPTNTAIHASLKVKARILSLLCHTALGIVTISDEVSTCFANSPASLRVSPDIALS
jgi:hypothetical protein